MTVIKSFFILILSETSTCTLIYRRLFRDIKSFVTLYFSQLKNEKYINSVLAEKTSFDIIWIYFLSITAIVKVYIKFNFKD